MEPATIALQDKVAIVTGGGSGVGRASGLVLAAEGMIPVLVGRDAQRLDETARQIADQGGRSLPIAADVRDEGAVAALVRRTVDELGGVDALVMAAAVGLYGRIETYALADWQETMATNLTAAFLCSRAVLPSMRSRGGGAIIAIASGAGKQGFPELAAYSASKFGLIGFMQSLAAEVKADGIKVSTVAPGSILTDFAGQSAEKKRESRTAGKSYLEAEDVAAAVRYLLQQPARAWTQEMNLWPV